MSLPVEVENLALLGWRLYPASRTSKAARFKEATDAATTDLAVLERWHREYGPSNWRVVMEGSGIWALDVDVPSADHEADGFAVMAGWVAKHGPLPDGPRTRSGGGGAALVFAHHGEPIAGKTGYPEPGLDPRRGRLSITVPPSVHITTRLPYRWLRAPWECPLPAAPDWLLELVKPEPEKPMPPIRAVLADGVAKRALDRAIDRIRACAAGRNDTLNRSSYTLGRWIGAGKLGIEECTGLLYAAARGVGLPHVEAKATIQSGLRKGMQKPMEIVDA